MANYGAKLTTFKVKPIKSIGDRYHLREIARGLTLPEGDLRAHILRANLAALEKLLIANPSPCQLRQLAIETLSDYGLQIPEERFIPPADLNELKALRPKPKPRRYRKKSSPADIEAQIARLQKKLESM